MSNGRIDSQPKSPVLVDAGRRGALARWGPARIVRLDDFDPDERAAILAAIEARRAARRVSAPADVEDGGKAA